MLNIVLFGPPGAGKGTQAKKLTEAYHLIHLSTGDLLRSEIEHGSALGMQAKSIMDRGELVPDDIVVRIIENKINNNSTAKGFIFDGFPRTTAQAHALDMLLERRNLAVTMMIALEVDNVELTRRLLVRGHESGRPDDQNEEVIKNRIVEYNNKTAPLKNYYSNKGKFHSVYGIGSIEQIFELLCATIDNKTKTKVVQPDGIPTIADVDLEEKHIKAEPKHIEHKPVAVKSSPVKPAPAKKKTTPTKKKIAKKPAKKAAKKTAKKVVKKATKKVVKKAAKPAKKVAKKVTKKIVKKAAKPAKKLVKKATKKAVKKATKKVLKKVVKKVTKKVAKPAKKTPAKKKKK